MTVWFKRARRGHSDPGVIEPPAHDHHTAEVKPAPRQVKGQLRFNLNSMIYAIFFKLAIIASFTKLAYNNG